MKKLHYLFAAVVAMFALSSCNQSDPGFVPEEGAEPFKVEITFDKETHILTATPNYDDVEYMLFVSKKCSVNETQGSLATAVYDICKDAQENKIMKKILHTGKFEVKLEDFHELVKNSDFYDWHETNVDYQAIAANLKKENGEWKANLEAGPVASLMFLCDDCNFHPENGPILTFGLDIQEVKDGFVTVKVTPSDNEKTYMCGLLPSMYVINDLPGRALGLVYKSYSESLGEGETMDKFYYKGEQTLSLQIMDMSNVEQAVIAFEQSIGELDNTKHYSYALFTIR